MNSGFFENAELPEDTESVVGTFPSLTRARSVVRELKQAGIPSEEISVVLAHPGTEKPRPKGGRSIRPSPLTVAALGGVGGALFASVLLTRQASLSSRVAALAKILGLSVTGATIGYLVGALASETWRAGMIHEPRRLIEPRYPSPAILVGATGRRQHLATARDILSRFGAANMRIYSGSSTRTS